MDHVTQNKARKSTEARKRQTYKPQGSRRLVPQDMRFHIVGLGPIGTLAAFHLRRAVPRSTPISLIHRKPLHPQREENVLKVERDGVVSTEDGFDVEYFPGSQTDTSMEATNPLTDIHSLIIATKAQATFGVVEALLPDRVPSAPFSRQPSRLGRHPVLLHEDDGAQRGELVEEALRAWTRLEVRLVI